MPTLTRTTGAPIVALLVTVVLSLAPPGPATGAPLDGTKDGCTTTSAEMDAFVRDQMSQTKAPGVAYAVVAPGGVVHANTFGTDGDDQPVTTATPFLWGSVAKPVAATVVMRLVDAGELELDDPVSDYLEDFRLPGVGGSGDGSAITIRHLLSQTSGLRTSVALTDRFDEGRRPRDVLDALAEDESVSAPGDEHHYSSTNYLVLAAVVEAATGRPYPEVLAEEVLDPLGMRDAVTTPEQAASSLPRGHRYVFGQPMPFTTPYDPAGTAYGYLGGSLDDAVAFARESLDGELLSEADHEAMFRAEVRTGEGRSYGLGWRRWSIGDDDAMIWHSGAASGYTASIILLPEKARAVIVLENVFGPFQENQLLATAFGLADMVYGEAPEESGGDLTYPLVLAALGLLCVLVLALAAWSVRRLVRGRGAPGPVRSGRAAIGFAGWLAGCAVVLYGLGIYLPAVADGMRLSQIPLWFPDVALLVYVTLGATVVLLVLRTAVMLRALRATLTLP